MVEITYLLVNKYYSLILQAFNMLFIQRVVRFNSFTY